MILKDNATNPEKRVRSRTISVGGSTARDQKIFSNAESSSPDYTEISSIPPMPLYALLAADEDTSQLGELTACTGSLNIKLSIKLKSHSKPSDEKAPSFHSCFKTLDV